MHPGRRRRPVRPHEAASPAHPRGDTLAIADCALDRSQLEAQHARYRELGRHVAGVRRLAGEVLVRFAQDPPPGLLEQTLEVERRCCPFFHMAYEAGERQLSITVESADQDLALDALFDAFS